MIHNNIPVITVNALVIGVVIVIVILVVILLLMVMMMIRRASYASNRDKLGSKNSLYQSTSSLHASEQVIYQSQIEIVIIIFTFTFGIRIMMMISVFSFPCSVPLSNHTRAKACFSWRTPASR